MTDRKFQQERNRRMEEDKLDDGKLEELIQQREAQRVQACQAEIEAALQKYDCEILPEPFIQQGVILAAVRLRAKRK